MANWLQLWVPAKVSFEEFLSYTILTSMLSIGRSILRAQEFGATQKISLLKSAVQTSVLSGEFRIARLSAKLKVSAGDPG